MAYNLQPKRGSFVGGKNILASEHVQFIEGGATIAGGQGSLECGQLIAKRTADGLFEKFDNTKLADYSDFGILNVDVDATTHNAVVGEVIIRGSVYEQKLVGDVANFKAQVKGDIRFVK